MRPILTGIETEYGFTVEGRGVKDQIDDSMAFVRSYPGECLLGWDYRQESPRADLRGFQVDQLAYDPVDAEFDEGRARPPASVERSDRVLSNGARFYNDHGHPEYATPEALSAHETAMHDLAGQEAVLSAARAFEKEVGEKIRVYKNNTDFHGSSYGTHESYLVPRNHGFKALYEAVTPLLVARQVLTGAGKVGAESGGPVRFQMSQRADFFSEAFNLETLFRRPFFNTRDEAHADPEKWIRLHVICGDANMMPACTKRKVALVRLALRLLDIDQVPTWRIPDPVKSFKLVSRDLVGEGRIELEGSSWTTPRQVLESYLDAADQHLSDGESEETVRECRALLELRGPDPDEFRRHVDWAAKHWLIDQFREAEGKNWSDSSLQSLDLSYCLLDQEEGLYSALVDAGEVGWHPGPDEVLLCLESAPLGSRAQMRSLFVRKFRDQIKALSWGRMTVLTNSGERTVDLPPDADYGDWVLDVDTIEEALTALERLS